MPNNTTAKEKPILFSKPMVRAIVSGTKTQTRRVIKNLIAYDDRWVWKISKHSTLTVAVGERIKSPYGEAGERLWVRERWRAMAGSMTLIGTDGCKNLIDYYSGFQEWKTCSYEQFLSPDNFELGKWKPSIHMPRWVSRIDLEITKIRVERLQDISEEDAKAEGCEIGWTSPQKISEERRKDYRGGFQQLWQSINGENSWSENPWVWVVEFKKIKPESL